MKKRVLISLCLCAAVLQGGCVNNASYQVTIWASQLGIPLGGPVLVMVVVFIKKLCAVYLPCCNPSIESCSWESEKYPPTPCNIPPFATPPPPKGGEPST